MTAKAWTHQLGPAVAGVIAGEELALSAQLFRTFAATVFFTLMASLVVSFAVIPMLGSRLLHLEIVRERLKVYQRQTKPLVDYYSARASFRAIDGNQAPDLVGAAMQGALASAMSVAQEGAR